MGFHRPGAQQTEFLRGLPADVAVSNNTFVMATGWAYVPTPNMTYLVEVFGLYTSTNTTVGLRFAIADSLTSFVMNGATYAVLRGASFTSTSELISSIVAGNAPLSPTGTTSSGAGGTPFYGFAIVTPTDNTPIGVIFATDGDAGTITLKQGKCLMRITKVP